MKTSVEIKIMKKYNHTFDIAFELNSDNDFNNVTKEELIDALQARINSLVANDDEIIEACGLPFDSYENE